MFVHNSKARTTLKKVLNNSGLKVLHIMVYHEPVQLFTDFKML